MNLQDEIHDLVLSFFEKIGSKITYIDGIYEIILPEKYVNYFQSEKLSFSFDEKTAHEKNCELIISGSNILSLVISSCISKGPISLKSGGNEAIRYHFQVVFSGVLNRTKMTYIDINLDTCMSANMPDVLKDYSSSLIEIDAKKITPTYIAALDELQRQTKQLETKFMDDSNHMFQKDYELFVKKYDSQIRELDEKINKKEDISDDPKKIKRFRFDTIGKINGLEQDKAHLIETLQEKHRISLEYRLIACNVIIG